MKINRFRYLCNFLAVLLIRLKIYFDNHLAKYMPRIPRKRPKPLFCQDCFARDLKQVPMTLEAYFIGPVDGWDIYWRCPICHETEELKETWFPFIFNWCNEKDLLRIGIEVV